jgi:hypothetical protein
VPSASGSYAFSEFSRRRCSISSILARIDAIRAAM